MDIQNREIENTGISSLKIAFNNVLDIILKLEIRTKTKFLQSGLENKH